MTTLAGQSVLVTGANRGMGREYVTQLLDRGVAKVYAAARDPRTIIDDDPRVMALQLDVTDPASIAAAAEIATDVGVLITDSAKSRPADVIRQVLDGIESGANEVLADDMTRQVRAQLSTPIA